MITLATLPQSSPQAVFEQSARHLLTQKRKSRTGTQCLYYGPDDTKCAVGCLLSPQELENIEELGWEDLVDIGKVPATHFDLILDLQETHDDYDVNMWSEKLIDVGKKHGLNTDFINNEFACN